MLQSSRLSTALEISGLTRGTLTIAIAFFALPLWAQGALDDVHITPQSDLRVASVASPTIQPGLDTHTRPMKVDVELVLVPVTVTDEVNRLVKGLEPGNFELFDSKHPQEIKHFSSEDVPISLGVVLDTSGSMNSKMKVAREAVVEFLKMANPQDECFLETFSDRPEENSDFTDSIETIQSKLAFTFPKGRTALLDAVYLALSKMRHARNSKRALLIISDGGDNHSRYTEKEVEALVKESDVMIYAVGIYDTYFQTQEELLGPSLLNEISSVTGGHAFTLSNPNDLPLVAKVIGTELRNQYIIGYRPDASQRNGKWHKIAVRLKHLKGTPPLHVYAKAGYYASSK